MTDEDKTRVHPIGKISAADHIDSNISDARPEEQNASVSELTSEFDQTLVTDGSDTSNAVSDNPSSFLTNSLSPPPASERTKSHLAVGDLLKGRFEIVEILGEGGMGIVFKAVDIRKLEAKSRNPYVAIKVLSPTLAGNATLIAGLQRECEKAQELSHPNIITVYDFDRDADYVFMSMEYLVGQPLGNIIRKSSVAGGLGLERVWPIIRQMGEALAYAHKKNIVHSDFKPANVFVTDKDEVKVLDFGIASRLGQSDSDETVFDARAEGGLTPPYASFEMLNGSRADQRDDIYAFGLVVYELLTGKHPYDRKPAAKVFLEQRSGQYSEPKPVSGLNRKQWQLLKSAIEILQEQRPMRLDEWLAQFEPKKQSKWMLGVGSGLLGLLVVGAGYYFLQRTSAPIGSSPKAPSAIENPETKLELPVSALNPEPPVADAGKDIDGVVGETIPLNGRNSRSQDGSLLSYSWRMIDRPESSSAMIVNPGSVAAEFVPDLAGRYAAELVVTDGNGTASQPVSVTINVLPAVEPGFSYESTSADGSLYIAAGKPSYIIGEELTLNFRVDKAGYVRVAYVSTTGEISELLPNKYQSGKVKPGIAYRIPPKGNSFKLQVTGPVGTDKIVAVFSSSPIPKVKDIALPEGTLVDALSALRDSAVTIQYDVLKE